MSEVPLYTPHPNWATQVRWGESEPGYSSPFEKNCFTEMCSASEEGSYLRLIDVWIPQLD